MIETTIPTFKTESSLWEMLADGTKTWDARKYDLTDERIKALSSWQGGGFVAFRNKATSEVLTFEYRGMWLDRRAPGWCFLRLGRRAEP